MSRFSNGTESKCRWCSLRRTSMCGDQRTSITYPFQIGSGIHFSSVDRHELVFHSSNYLPGKRSSLFHRHASSFSAIPAHKIILHRPTRRLSGSVTFVKTFVGVNMRYRCHDESSKSLDGRSDRGFELGGDFMRLVEGYAPVHFDL